MYFACHAAIVKNSLRLMATSNSSAHDIEADSLDKEKLVACISSKGPRLIAGFFDCCRVFHESGETQPAASSKSQPAVMAGSTPLHVLAPMGSSRDLVQQAMLYATKQSSRVADGKPGHGGVFTRFLLKYIQE